MIRAGIWIIVWLRGKDTRHPPSPFNGDEWEAKPLYLVASKAFCFVSNIMYLRKLWSIIILRKPGSVFSCCFFPPWNVVPLLANTSYTSIWYRYSPANYQLITIKLKRMLKYLRCFLVFFINSGADYYLLLYFIPPARSQQLCHPDVTLVLAHLRWHRFEDKFQSSQTSQKTGSNDVSL